MGTKSETRKSIRKQVLARDRFQCSVCGSAHSLQVHHIVHRSKGGHDTVDNLITLCSDCHMIVHNQLKSLIKSGVDVLKYRYIILFVSIEYFLLIIVLLSSFLISSFLTPSFGFLKK